MLINRNTVISITIKVKASKVRNLFRFLWFQPDFVANYEGITKAYRIVDSNSLFLALDKALNNIYSTYNQDE